MLSFWCIPFQGNVVLLSNCLRNNYIYFYRFELCSTLVRRVCYCRGQGLIQRLITVQMLRIGDSAKDGISIATSTRKKPRIIHKKEREERKSWRKGTNCCERAASGHSKAVVHTSQHLWLSHLRPPTDQES